MHPALLAGMPRRMVAPVTSAIACAVAVAESWTVRHTVSLMVKIIARTIPCPAGPKIRRPSTGRLCLPTERRPVEPLERGGVSG